MKEQEQEEYSYERESIESINLVDELAEKLNPIKSDVQKFYDSKNKKINWLEFPVEVSQLKSLNIWILMMASREN